MSSSDSTVNIHLRMLDDSYEDPEEFRNLDEIFNSEEINDDIKTNVSLLKEKYNTLKINLMSHIERLQEGTDLKALQIEDLKANEKSLLEELCTSRTENFDLQNTIAKLQMKTTMGNPALWDEFEAINRLYYSTEQELKAMKAMLEDYHVYSATVQDRNVYLQAEFIKLQAKLKNANENSVQQKLESDTQVHSLKEYTINQDKRISTLFLRHSKREEELLQQVCNTSSSQSLSQELASERTSTSDLDPIGDSLELSPSVSTTGEPQSMFAYTISCESDFHYEPSEMRRQTKQVSSSESLASKPNGVEKQRVSYKIQVRQLEIKLKAAKETLKIEKTSHLKRLKALEQERQQLFYENEEIKSKLKDAEEILDQSLANENTMRSQAEEINAKYVDIKAKVTKCLEEVTFVQSLFVQTPAEGEVADEANLDDMLTDVRMNLNNIVTDEQEPAAVQTATDTYQDRTTLKRQEIELAEVKRQMGKLDAKYNAVSKELQSIHLKRMKDKECENCVKLSQIINNLETHIDSISSVSTDETVEFYKSHCEYQTRRINELLKEKEKLVSEAQAHDLSATQDRSQLQNDYLALKAKYDKLRTVARMRWLEIKELQARFGFDAAQGRSSD